MYSFDIDATPVRLRMLQLFDQGLRDAKVAAILRMDFPELGTDISPGIVAACRLAICKDAANHTPRDFGPADLFDTPSPPPVLPHSPDGDTETILPCDSASNVMPARIRQVFESLNERSTLDAHSASYDSSTLVSTLRDMQKTEEQSTRVQRQSSPKYDAEGVFKLPGTPPSVRKKAEKNTVRMSQNTEPMVVGHAVGKEQAETGGETQKVSGDTNGMNGEILQSSSDESEKEASNAKRLRDLAFHLLDQHLTEEQVQKTLGMSREQLARELVQDVQEEQRAGAMQKKGMKNGGM